MLSSKLPSRYFPLIGFGEESGICSDKVLAFLLPQVPYKKYEFSRSSKTCYYRRVSCSAALSVTSPLALLNVLLVSSSAQTKV